MAEGNACFRRNMHGEWRGGHAVTVMKFERFGMGVRINFRSRVHGNVLHIYVAFGGSPISESNK